MTKPTITEQDRALAREIANLTAAHLEPGLFKHPDESECGFCAGWKAAIDWVRVGTDVSVSALIAAYGESVTAEAIAAKEQAERTLEYERARRHGAEADAEREKSRADTWQLRAEQAEARLADNSPGTPSGRLEALAEYAVQHCGHNPLAAAPPELAIMERLEQAERELAEARKQRDAVFADKTALMLAAQKAGFLTYAKDGGVFEYNPEMVAELRRLNVEDERDEALAQVEKLRKALERTGPLFTSEEQSPPKTHVYGDRAILAIRAALALTPPVAPDSTQKTERVIEAARAFLGRMDAIESDERYMSVWCVNQLHAGPYIGPKWEAEREALRAALDGGGRGRGNEKARRNRHASPGPLNADARTGKDQKQAGAIGAPADRRRGSDDDLS